MQRLAAATMPHAGPAVARNIYGRTRKYNMANGKRHSVLVSKITCQSTSELGNDEVVIIYQADGGVPMRWADGQKYQRMNPDPDPGNDEVSTWNTNLSLDFDHDVLVTLWDHDDPIPSNSEYLISVDYRPGNVPASFNMANNNGANYTIYASQID
jgi:hypothetical protein